MDVQDVQHLWPKKSTPDFESASQSVATGGFNLNGSVLDVAQNFVSNVSNLLGLSMVHDVIVMLWQCQRESLMH